jgi:CDP-diacylglycerol--serine O-phosphatidyltransferase
MKEHIPNTITALNLVFGCFSIIDALQGNLTQASLWIGGAAVLDFFDGFVARLLKVSSDLGKQLDSLADVVSFGVAPGMIFYAMSGQCFGEGFCINKLLPFLIPAFSAVRLAKFNIDTRQSDLFIGLPTPANAMFIASLPFIFQYDSLGLGWVMEHRFFLILFPLLSAYLLVAELPLLALKFKHFGWRGNEFRYVLILISILSVVFFQYLGVALAIVFYVLLSVLQQMIQPKKI